jgi:hypothetical protein
MNDMRHGTCPLCQHTEIIEAAARDAVHSMPTRTLAVAVTQERGFFDGQVTLDARHHGALSMYVCRACGYVQWFADAPGKIPIGPEAHTRLVTPATPPTPYR